ADRGRQPGRSAGQRGPKAWSATEWARKLPSREGTSGKYPETCSDTRVCFGSATTAWCTAEQPQEGTWYLHGQRVRPPQPPPRCAFGLQTRGAAQPLRARVPAGSAGGARQSLAGTGTPPRVRRAADPAPPVRARAPDHV